MIYLTVIRVNRLENVVNNTQLFISWEIIQKINEDLRICIYLL